jgi:outer membrane lipoprotein-sorting protein
MNIKGISFGISCSLLAIQTAAADRFDEIKSSLAEAECIQIEFLSMLESDIFDRTDTARGTAYLAKDGRFLVTVGDDKYLMAGDLLYSYSQANDQVIIEDVDSSRAVSSEVAYIRKLDDWYKTRILRPDREYFLVRTGPEGKSIPDSMTVSIDLKQGRISRIAYFDLNDELVTVVFVKETHHDACDQRQFEPDFPKSAERVKL